jgi:hypothetical protein
VDPRASLDDVEKRKFLTLPGLELRSLDRPARSQSLYRLSYPSSLISDSLYDKLVTEGVPRHEISMNNAVLIIAFGNKSKRLNKQSYLEFRIRDDVFEGVFLMAP